MPSFKNISVNIVTPSGALPSLHQDISDTSILCECYILSKSDTPFWVSITPEKDFFSRKIDDTPTEFSSHSANNKMWDVNGTVFHCTEDDQELEDYASDSTKQEDEDEEWHLLAEVFLDGRSVPETSVIVYLPWNSPVEERVIRGRPAITSDGNTVEVPWLFKDVGLEGSLEALSLVNNDADGDLTTTNARSLSKKDESEDMLVRSMQSLGHKGKKKEISREGMGQIKIVLQKIAITGLCIDIDYIPDLLGNDDSMKVGKSIKDVSHTAGFGKPDSVYFTATRKSYCLLSTESEPYAKFLFHYRGEKQMRKLGFLDSPGPSHKKLDRLIPFLTPLPITSNFKPSKPWEKSKARFGPEGPVSSTSEEQSEKEIVSEGDQTLKRQLSETSRSDKGQISIRESSSSEHSDESDESSGRQDSETVDTLASKIPDAKSLFSLPDSEHETDFGLAISAAAKFTISLPKNSEPRNKRDIRSDDTTDASESDTGYEGDTETPKLMRERKGKNALEEEENMKELANKLRLVQLKRSHSDDSDSENEAEAEEDENEKKVQRYWQPKRIRRYKDDAGSMEAKEERMSEVEKD